MTAFLPGVDPGICVRGAVPSFLPSHFPTLPLRSRVALKPARGFRECYKLPQQSPEHRALAKNELAAL